MSFRLLLNPHQLTRPGDIGGLGCVEVEFAFLMLIPFVLQCRAPGVDEIGKSMVDKVPCTLGHAIGVRVDKKIPMFNVTLRVHRVRDYDCFEGSIVASCVSIYLILPYS